MKKDVEFQCPDCRQWLEAPTDMAGLFVECPKCDAVIKVPAKSGDVVESSGGGRRTPPAAPSKEPAASDEMKGSTIRINLPPNLGIPDAPKRRFVIRRKS